MPGIDDLYCWKFLPEKQHLFSKNMSDHSTGAYKELWKGVGITFEAIPSSSTAINSAKNHESMVSLSVREETPKS